jgi:hypothetical protein
MMRGLGKVAATVLFAVAGAALADEPGVVSLFDGKTLDGWVPEHSDRFTVRDGVIVGKGGGGWLRSAKSYKDFELQLEYRVLDGGADSGILFRATAESTANEPYWPMRGFQLQIVDTNGNLKIFGHGTAPPTFERNAESLKKAMKGPGIWQTISLKVVSKRAEVALNGTPVTVSEGISLPAGHIGLQGGTGPFEWRNIKVRELSSP